MGSSELAHGWKRQVGQKRGDKRGRGGKEEKAVESRQGAAQPAGDVFDEE